MIGRWMYLLRFSIYCTPLDSDREEKTSFVEPSPKESCLMLDLSTTSLSVMMPLPSLEIVFSELRFL